MALTSQPVLDGLWARLLEALSGQLAPAVFDSWLRPCRLLAVEGDHLRIGAPNPFARDWLMQHHLHAVQGAAEKCLGGHPQVSNLVGRYDRTIESTLHLRYLRRRLIEPIRPGRLPGRRGAPVARV